MADKTPKIDDTFLKMILKDEQNRSVGLDTEDTSDLMWQRMTALDYAKGKMPDMQHLENRSGQMSLDVADGIEQALPDIVEIFLQEDVVSFEPVGPDDEDAAKQEADYVSHVVFKDNDGFKLISTGIKDALTEKTGYFYWYWEDAAEPKEQTFEDQTVFDLQNALISNKSDPNSEVANIYVESSTQTAETYDEAGEDVSDASLTPLTSMNQLTDGSIDLINARFTFTVKEKQAEGKVCIKNWTASDVAVSDDTLILGEGTYCVFRSRMRRQDALMDGYDPDLVEQIPRTGLTNDELVYARDTVGEHQWDGSGNTPNMDSIELFYHYCRIYDEKTKKLNLWYVVTGGDDSRVILKKEVVDYVPASMITPFPVPHRFYGESMADKLIPIQRVKTAITRMMLDSGYFAMNQRVEVAESSVSKHTMSDLLKNTPGTPIRVRTPGGINPVSTAPLQFDTFAALEYFSTQGEQRSGIARSAMGLDPDTLHETSSAALAQMSAAQRRIRYVARNFAENGIKALFLGVHRCIRENASSTRIARLNGKYVPVNPSAWRIRENMNVEIGTTGGREFDVANLSNILQIQQGFGQAQGGLDGPLVGPQNVLETAHALVSRSGIKNPDKYFPDPAQVQPPAPPNPAASPEAMKAQADQQAAMAQLQATQQIEQAKIQSNQAIEQAKIQSTQAIAVAQLQADVQYKQQELQLEAYKIKGDIDVAREKNMLDAQAASEGNQVDTHNNLMQADLKNKQIDAEVGLKGQQLDSEKQLELVRIHLDDENTKLSILADQETETHKIDLTAQPTDIHLARVDLGGEPG